MSFKATQRNFIIRESGGGFREAETLVLGESLPITTTPGGLPELNLARAGEVNLMPSGGDDTARIQAALNEYPQVRLGPGTFLVSTLVQLGQFFVPASGNRLVGSGIDRTRVKMTALTVAFGIRADDCSIEDLTIEGFGGAGTGIQSLLVFSSPTFSLRGTTIRNVKVEAAGLGIQAENTNDMEVTNFTMTGASGFGISARGFAAGTSGLRLSGIKVENVANGIQVRDYSRVSMEGVTVRSCTTTGLVLEGGTAHSLAAVRVTDSATGVTLKNVVSAAAGGGVETVTCPQGFLVEGSKDVALSGCRARGANGSLIIRTSEDVVVGAFRSDMTGAPGPANAPHVKVETSPGVFVTGVRIVNPGVVPPFEVDVSLAGSRVLFGPNNFNPALINSGGNYAQL